MIGKGGGGVGGGGGETSTQRCAAANRMILHLDGQQCEPF